MFVLGENHFRKWGCLVGPENSIFRKLKSVDQKKKAFDHGNHFTLLFSLQSISGKWERERERAHGVVISSPCRLWSRWQTFQSPLIAISRRSRSREEGEIAIAPLIAISDRDRRHGRRMVFNVIVDDFFLGCGLCFSGFVFSFFFSKH